MIALLILGATLTIGFLFGVAVCVLAAKIFNKFPDKF
jgi:hypothetical protein